MKTAPTRSAPGCVRPPARGLTVAQQNAVDLLAAGRNDTETAEALGLHRVTVTRWRRYCPEFRAALADQRAAVWGASGDRLRSLLPKALDALAEALESAEGTDRLTVALALLKLAGPLPLVPTEPTDADELVRRVVDDERERLRDRRAALDRLNGLPAYTDHVETVRAQLAQLAQLAQPDGARPDDDPGRS